MKYNKRYYHRRNQWLKQKYNLTLDDYNTMVIKQGNKCAICSKTYKIKPYRVDHDHKTGRVRGLLCSHCNKLLGWHEKLNKLTPREKAYLQ